MESFDLQKREASDTISLTHAFAKQKEQGTFAPYEGLVHCCPNEMTEYKCQCSK